MRKLLIGKSRCPAFPARYYLLEEEESSYGVGIELEGESAAVTGLSPSRRRVKELAERLSQGMVTPVALRDVVDDWLLEDAFS